MTSNLNCVTGNPASSSEIIMSGTLAPIVTFTSCFDTITTVNAKPIKLKGGIPLGGTYSGPGVNSLTGVFTPAIAGVGTKTITYTYTNAVLAKRHGIPFYVAIPLSTIDWNLKRGFDIPIEERCESEVLGSWGTITNPQSAIRNPQLNRRAYVRVANPTSGARNPGFDVTPPELITGIITPAGIFKPKELWPQRRKLGLAS